MSSNPHTRDSADEFPKVVAGLDRLAERFEDRRYPGRAWQAPRPNPRRVFFRIGAGLAAAAAVALLAVVIDRAPQDPARPAPPDAAFDASGEQILLRIITAAVEQPDEEPDYEVTYVSDVLFDIYDPSLPEGADGTLEPSSLTPDWWDLTETDSGRDS